MRAGTQNDTPLRMIFYVCIIADLLLKQGGYAAYTAYTAKIPMAFEIPGIWSRSFHRRMYR